MKLRSNAYSLILLLSLRVLGAQPAAQPAVQPAIASLTAAVDERCLMYSMRGEVRLLLFWYGRDRVGGGKIALRQSADAESQGFWEEVELLIGSHPERVPGGVNLWGYGKERSFWMPQPYAAPRLQRSRFEGFMRPTDDLPANAQDYVMMRKKEGAFLYKAICSEVAEELASSEIRLFASHTDFNYRAPQEVLDAFGAQQSTALPILQREVARAVAGYDRPTGFLTALRELIRQIITQSAQGTHPESGGRPAMRYAYNAQPYTLTARKISARPAFRLPDGALPASAWQDVVEVAWRLENVSQGGSQDFTFWLARKGPLQGLPLRITYQPKWWLRLRLDLEQVQGEWRTDRLATAGANSR